MEVRDGIRRYGDGDRMNHWLVAICFFMAALSGLAFFHPAMYFLTGLFGGGPWARILHPFFGVAMFVLFLGMILRFAKHNLINAQDRRWLAGWRDVIADREDRVPEVGRYNAGQKLIFWLMVISLVALLVTGIVFWRPYFRYNFGIDAIRIATVVHSVSAVVLMLGIVIHIYAAFWVKGTLRAMTIGTVAKNWARKHHLGWYKEESASAKR